MAAVPTAVAHPSPTFVRPAWQRRVARWLRGGGLALAVLTGTVGASEDEAALRARMQQAVWPAEIVEASARYLARHPHGPAAEEARSLRVAADRGARALDRADVRLYRSAFVAEPAVLQEELRRAALGDPGAAGALARRYRIGDGVAADANRSIGWLQYAAMLGDERASYELALHYRRDANPALAAKYEALAIEGGFTPPRDLDHVRK